MICLSHQKQIDLALIIYSGDYGAFPMRISVTNGGTKELLNSGHTVPHFAALKAYKIQPQLFICPFETDRKAATNFESVSDLNLSYFVNADASTNNPSQTILTGDRFLQIKGHPVPHGLLMVTRNQDLSWTPNFHAKGGCLGFADGHIEFSHNNNLPSLIAAQPLATNHFSIP